jgi:hypothetical protein
MIFTVFLGSNAMMYMLADIGLVVFGGTVIGHESIRPRLCTIYTINPRHSKMGEKEVKSERPKYG